MSKIESKAKSSMKLYDSMPEDVQRLSRKYGNIVDEFFRGGYDAHEIKEELKILGRYGS